MKTTEDLLEEHGIDDYSSPSILAIQNLMKEYAKQFINEFEKRVEPTYDINYEGQAFLLTNAEYVAEELKEELL